MRIGFIGAGMMGSALIRCLHKQKIAKSIVAYDRNGQNLKAIKRFAKAAKNSIYVVNGSGIVFIAVKPQDIDEVLGEIKDSVTKNHVIVSIAAGIKTGYIESRLKGKAKVIRVMPNIGCIVGEMAAAYSSGKYATKEDLSNVEGLLNAAGKCFRVDEGLLDTVTAISGSGPAFFAYIVGIMKQAGATDGLNKDIALKLAAQTAIGTGKLIVNGMMPNEIIKAVASPKGTTEEGLKVLYKSDFREVLENAIKAAAKRSRELGR